MLNKTNSLVLWFDDINKEDVPLVGGKSASLGEMTSRTQVPVPYGFATTAQAYRNFIEKTGLGEKIAALIGELDDVEDSRKLGDITAAIRQEIMAAQMPDDLAAEIAAAYRELAKRAGEANPYVAVRSSATAEDLPDASFAGQQDTYLNVQGEEEVIARVKECYASTFTDRAVYYRVKKEFDHLEVALSAVVQMMVFSQAAGVMFTVDVATGNDTSIFIEGSWGLGEYVVQGTVTPDSYLVRKSDRAIEQRSIHEKPVMLVRKAGGGCEEQKVPADLAKASVLTDQQIQELAGYAIDIEKHYGSYMDIEWGIDERNGKLWILQARPETVWSRRNKGKGAAGDTAVKAPIAAGAEITVDATNGIVYDGLISDLVAKPAVQGSNAIPEFIETFPVTGTRVYMNLGDPELAEKYAGLPCDGIGLMREEFIWTTYIHEHPLYLIETGRADKVVEGLAEGIRQVCQAMAPRPVVLRFSDFKSSEYRDLKGGDKYEPYEPSALLGWRGASRYYDPKYIEAFKLELQAVKKVREEYGFKNLNVMIPFCRTVEEAAKVTALMAEQGLRRNADFKVWLMAEIPANIILADQFNQFVDGYSIGSNDLTMLVLGCDRDNETVSHIFSERDLAVKRAIRHLIEVAHRDGKTVSICGQAPSVYPDFTEFLIKSGIDSISVNPDAVKAARRQVAQVEQRIMLDKLTGRGIADTTDYTW